LVSPARLAAGPSGPRIAAHTRRPPTRHHDDEALPFFDETRVPVEVIELRAPETEGLSPEDYEIISHKESYRLAQRPGSYVVIKYRRPVVKIKASQALVCAPAPATGSSTAAGRT
jgi:transposase